MKTRIKIFLSSLDNTNEDSFNFLKLALKQIDKLTSKGIIHKNTAARKKSKLMTKFNSYSIK